MIASEVRQHQTGEGNGKNIGKYDKNEGLGSAILNLGFCHKDDFSNIEIKIRKNEEGNTLKGATSGYSFSGVLLDQPGSYNLYD